MWKVIPDANDRLHTCLIERVGAEVHDLWLRRLEIDDVFGETATLTVPTKFLRKWNKDHYSELLDQTLAQLIPGVVRTEILVRELVRTPAYVEKFDAKSEKTLPVMSVPPAAPILPVIKSAKEHSVPKEQIYGVVEDVPVPRLRPTNPHMVQYIQQYIAARDNLTVKDLLCTRRAQRVSYPRQVAMYLARLITKRSLHDIGRRFGGRDHSTVLHNIRKIDVRVKNDSRFAAEIELMRVEISVGYYAPEAL